jgi:hypothetical protein
VAGSPAPAVAGSPAPAVSASPAPVVAAPPAPAVSASPAPAVAAPPAPAAPPMPPAATAARAAPSVRYREDAAAGGADDDRHWRDQLCDWAAAVLAHPRSARALPALPETRLAIAVARLALEPPAERALALLYGARLLGHDAVAAATVARALGDGEPPDDPAWCEALARGPLAERRLVRQRRDGRLALRAVAARFLDGAAPRVPLLAGRDGAPESQRTLRLPLDGESLEYLGARLVREHGHRLALITLDDMEPQHALADALLEARLHDAWPLIEDSGEPAEWFPALDDGPILIAVRGEPAELLAQLPEL